MRDNNVFFSAGLQRRRDLICHLCGFQFKNSRISQHFRRHHKVVDEGRLRDLKVEMRKFSEKIAAR